MFRLRWALVAIPVLAVAALALMVARGGGSSDESGGVVVSCDGIDELASYRYTISVKLALPAVQPGEPGLGEFAGTLAALLSDFSIAGAYVAPDRRQATLAFQGDEVELRRIGDEKWERLGSSWENLDEDAPEIEELTPSVVCAELVMGLAPSLDPAGPVEEALNGVAARRYTTGEADLAQLGELLGVAPETPLPDEFAVSVWLAEGDWPLKLEVRSRATDAEGQAGSVELVMELRDLNDGGISIEPPLVSQP